MTSPIHPAWRTESRKATRIAQDDQNEAFLSLRGIVVDDPLFRLTSRQRMAVQLLAAGESMADGAARMGILPISFKELLKDAFAAMNLDGDWASKCARAGWIVGRGGR
jgi:hypothetical protein